MRRSRLLAAFLALLSALCVLGAPAPAIAILPAAVSESAPGNGVQAPSPAIETKQDAGSDEAIARRITGIFSELPAFGKVGVSARAGVVRLTGKVARTEDIARAEAIASRVQGVVTVENALERDLSVNESLGSLDSLSQRVTSLVRMLPLLAIATLVGLAIAGFGYLLAGLTGLWNRVAPNSFMAGLIASAIRFVFSVGALVIALDMIGASALLGAVLGGAGLIGIALGFAMRDTIENYVASLMLSVRQPFRPNDHVVIDSHEGRVIRLTTRATILMTLDGNHLRIPNAAVFKAVILNYTRNPQRRFDFELGIDADDDPTAARHLGVDVLRGMDFVLDDPEPQARVEEVGDSNIVIRFLGWIDQTQTDWFKARSRAIPAVKKALEDAGFALPEPIYRLRFDAGAPLPLEGLESGKAAPAPPAAKAEAKPAFAVEQDTSPQNEVERMVEAERASDGDAKDLLDPARPVE